MPMSKHGLGRLPAPDPRDKLYGASLYLPRGFHFRRLSLWRHWRTGLLLDQGATSACVGFAWEGWERCSPLRNTNGPPARYIYQEAQKIDEWPGENYEGTSVRAGAKVLRASGHFKEYIWPQNANEIKQWILTKGPVVVGTNWYYSMFDPVKGYIYPEGQTAGGHAWLVIGYSRIRNSFRGMCAWGDWADKGKFWIRFDDMEQLMLEDGEACGAVEVTLPTKEGSE